MKSKAKAMVATIKNILEEKKARDVVDIDVSKITILAESMVIASGRSTIQVKSLAQAVEEQMAKAGHELIRSEGHKEGLWVILDYSYVIVHILHYEEREFYNLERLWDHTKRELQIKTGL